MTGFGVLLRKELLEQWRTARLLVVLAVFVLIGLSSPLVARFTPEIVAAVGGGQFQITLPPPTADDAIDQLLKNLGQVGALTAVLLAMGSVAGEKERGTAGMLLTKPAGRTAFLLAKLVAIATTLGIGTLAAGAGAWFYTLVLFRELPVLGFAAGTIVIWVSLVAYAAVTFLGSVLTRSVVAAAGVGIAGFVVLGLLSILPSVGRYLPVGLGAVSHGLAVGAPVDALAPVAAVVGEIAAIVAVADRAFARQEL